MSAADQHELAKTVRLFIASQFCLYAATVICILLRPRGLTANQGLSYYGNYVRTIVPYATGLLLSAGLAIAAVESMPHTRRVAPMRYAFYISALATIGIIATPIQTALWVRSIHDMIVIILFCLQIVLSVWLVQQFRNDWVNVGLITLQATSAILAAFYINPPTGFLMESQLAFEIIFGLIVVRALSAMSLQTKDRLQSVKDNTQRVV